MKRSASLFVESYRAWLLIVGLLLSLSVFGVVAWHADAQEREPDLIYFQLGSRPTVTGLHNEIADPAQPLSGSPNGPVAVIPPVVTKSFSPSTVNVGGVSTLSLTITNSDPATAQTNVHFTDVFPAGLVVANNPNVVGSCSIGSTGTAAYALGASSVGFISGTLAANGGNCSFTIDILATTAGLKHNSFAGTSTEAGTGPAGTADLAVNGPPAIAKAFGAPTIAVGGTTSLTFTITNPSASLDYTGVAFTDTLPAGIAVATPNGLSTNCPNGTVTATAGSGSVSLSGLALSAGSSCTISTNIIGITPSFNSNSVTVSSTNGGTGNTATASITVLAAPVITKSFSPTNIPVGGTSVLMFGITNPNGANSLTGISFTDSLPAGIKVATPNGLSTNCPSGTITATAGSGTVSLSGGGLAVGANCNISVDVIGVSAGTNINAVTVTSANAGTGNTATAQLVVYKPVTHFSITAPANATAGTPFNFTVKALDEDNNVVPFYTGTVHFTSTDNSPADLPLNVMLVNGVGTFSARLFKGGIQTIDAYDLANLSINGKSNNINVGAGQAYGFRITAPANVMPGVPFNFTVAAVDAYGNPGATGTGTVVFGSTDGLATVPANIILTNGVGTFSATLRTPGGWAITAHDISLPIMGSSNNINVASIHFAVSAPSSATVGIPFSFTVTAQDLFNNTLTGYTGTVHFTSSDGSATLPGDATLTNGMGTFNATLRTVGARTITATDTNASTVNGTSNGINVTSPVPMKKSPFDFDGDGKTDISVFRGSTGTWFLNRSQAGFAALQFGMSGDIITPADFTGDGKADIAVWRPATGTWYVMRSEDSTFYGFGFGQTGDLPVAADFDGDGRADMGVYRPSVGTWFVQRSTAGFLGMQFGTAEDKPTVGDFDGDGKADISLFRPSTGTWYRINSSNGAVVGAQFGSMGDIPLVMDVDGDGKANYAVFRPSNNTWYTARPTGVPAQNFDAVQLGAPGDIPVPGDYDGDGKTDFAVFHPQNGTWSLLRSTAGFTAVQFGTDGDRPGPNAFVY